MTGTLLFVDDGYKAMAHSPAYFIAAAIADGGYGWIHASAERVADPVIAQLIDKITVDPVANWSGILVAPSPRVLLKPLDAPVVGAVTATLRPWAEPLLSRKET